MPQWQSVVSLFLYFFPWEWKDRSWVSIHVLLCKFWILHEKCWMETPRRKYTIISKMCLKNIFAHDKANILCITKCATNKVNVKSYLIYSIFVDSLLPLCGLWNLCSNIKSHVTTTARPIELISYLRFLKWPILIENPQTLKRKKTLELPSRFKWNTSATRLQNDGLFPWSLLVCHTNNC